MLEKDIQNYIYSNPSYLFPGETIQKKFKEYSIQGKRIDLLFRIDGVGHIVEIKNVPLERKHIGQVIEYYGLLKSFKDETNLRMILVAPRIEIWQKTFLEEIGIKCFEFKENLDSRTANNSIEIISHKRDDKRTQKLWIVPVSFDSTLRERIENKYSVLQDILKQQNSKLNSVWFNSVHPSKFVHQASEGDYLIVNIFKDGEHKVYPPRQIIHIEEADSRKYYYVETTPEEENQTLIFQTFAAELVKLGCDIKIKESTNRLIPKRIEQCVYDVWEIS